MNWSGTAIQQIKVLLFYFSLLSRKLGIGLKLAPAESLWNKKTFHTFLKKKKISPHSFPHAAPTRAQPRRCQSAQTRLLWWPHCLQVRCWCWSQWSQWRRWSSYCCWNHPSLVQIFSEKNNFFSLRCVRMLMRYHMLHWFQGICAWACGRTRSLPMRPSDACEQQQHH